MARLSSEAMSKRPDGPIFRQQSNKIRPKQRSRPPKRTIKQALMDLLRPNRSATRATTYIQTVGSGILRKAPAPTPRLPNFSTASCLPSVGHSDLQGPSSALSRSPRITITAFADRETDSWRLLPKTSLSHFDLSPSQPVFAGPQNIVYQSVPHGLRAGASRQASLVSLQPSSAPSLIECPSASTLRVCSSIKHMRPHGVRGDVHPRSVNSQYTSRALQTPSQIGGSPNCQAGGSFSNGSDFDSSDAGRGTEALLSTVQHFKSFCVLDTAQPGYPVTGTCADLRYIFDVGEQFVLNNQECEGNSMDIVSGFDAAGNEIVHLVLFTPLIAVSSGHSRFMLVSLIDVTEFICESANQSPGLETVSEEGSFSDEVLTPPYLDWRSPHWADQMHHLSADDLLGGCSIVECDTAEYPTTRKEADDDIWLSLVEEDESRSNKSRSSQLGTFAPQTPCSRSSTCSHASSTDDTLEEFMSNLQELYSDFFLLGISPLTDTAYEMCNVSPRIYESKEFVTGHLSKTPPHVIERLSEQLGQLQPFNLEVSWGDHGQAKSLYCSPLYTSSSVTWICYLVDKRMPPLW